MASKTLLNACLCYSVDVDIPISVDDNEKGCVKVAIWYQSTRFLNFHPLLVK